MTIKPEYQSQNLQQAFAHIAEECAEVCQAYAKMQRFGMDAVNPELEPGDEGYGITNAQWFNRELHDVINAIKALHPILEAFKGAEE